MKDTSGPSSPPPPAIETWTKEQAAAVSVVWKAVGIPERQQMCRMQGTILRRALVRSAAWDLLIQEHYHNTGSHGKLLEMVSEGNGTTSFSVVGPYPSNPPSAAGAFSYLCGHGVCLCTGLSYASL